MRIVVIRSYEDFPQYLRETLHNFELIIEEFIDYDSGMKFAISNNIAIILVYEKQSYLEKVELFCRQGPDKYLPVSAITKITDRKSTRLNSSHLVISYAVFCLKKKMYPSHLPTWIPRCKGSSTNLAKVHR